MQHRTCCCAPSRVTAVRCAQGKRVVFLRLLRRRCDGRERARSCRIYVHAFTPYRSGRCSTALAQLRAISGRRHRGISAPRSARARRTATSLASQGRGTSRYAARRRASCGGGHSPRAAHMTCGARHTRTTKAGSAAAKPVHPRGRTAAVGRCFLATVPASARQQCSAWTSPVMRHTVQRRARGGTAFAHIPMWSTARVPQRAMITP